MDRAERGPAVVDLRPRDPLQRGQCRSRLQADQLLHEPGGAGPVGARRLRSHQPGGAAAGGEEVQAERRPGERQERDRRARAAELRRIRPRLAGSGVRIVATVDATRPVAAASERSAAGGPPLVHRLRRAMPRFASIVITFLILLVLFGPVLLLAVFSFNDSPIISL